MISDYIQDWLDIIEKMNNDNTYKLAWGRSILETIGEKDIVGDIIISFDELSEKIIKYYWNQLYFFNLTQGSNKNKLPVIEQIVRKMIADYQKDTESSIPVWYEKAESFFRKDKKKYKQIINDVSNALNTNVCWRFMNVGDMQLLVYDLDRKNKTISFTEYEAKELQEYRFVLSQLLNYRWAQLLEQFNVAPRIAKKVRGLSDNKLRRNSLKKYKDLLLNYYKGVPIDFYTNEPIEGKITVDHVIPWSFMYSDDIWNLVLTSKSNNSSKLNTVPSVETIEKLKKRNDDLVSFVKERKHYDDLLEAINNSYVDKFYNSMKM